VRHRQSREVEKKVHPIEPRALLLGPDDDHNDGGPDYGVSVSGANPDRERHL